MVDIMQILKAFSSAGFKCQGAFETCLNADYNDSNLAPFQKLRLNIASHTRYAVAHPSISLITGIGN